VSVVGEVRSWAIVGAIVALAAPAAGQAEVSKKPPPKPLPGSSGVAQYVESVPSASGPRAAGQSRSGKAKLSAKAKKKLAQVDTATAQQLERVATSPAYGAPTKAKAARKTAPKKKVPEPESRPRPVERVPAVRKVTEQSTPAAVAGAVTGEENGSLDIVLIGLGLFTLAAIGAAVLRARRSRSG
jgi:hypothetical protein